MLVRGGLSLCSFPLRTPQRLLGLFGSDRVRPRRFKTEFAGGFLGRAFGGCFDDGAEGIAHQTGVFAVGVIDAPELIAWTRSRSRAHGRSSPQPVFAKMYQLHKMQGQSEDSPWSGPSMSWQKHSHDDTHREFGGKERGLTRRREARVLAAIRQALGGRKIQILAQEGISPMRPS